MNRPAPSRVRLYDEQDLDSVLRTMAYQALALMPAQPLVLVGIQRRGEPLARRLQLHLQQLTGSAAPLPLYPIKVKRYADDLTCKSPSRTSSNVMCRLSKRISAWK